MEGSQVEIGNAFLRGCSFLPIFHLLPAGFGIFCFGLLHLGRHARVCCGRILVLCLLWEKSYTLHSILRRYLSMFCVCVAKSLNLVPWTGMTVTKTATKTQMYVSACQNRIACTEGLDNWGGPETMVSRASNGHTGIRMLASWRVSVAQARLL